MGVSTTDLSAPPNSVKLSGCMTSSSSVTPWPLAGKHRSAAAVFRRPQLVMSRDAGWCGQRAWRKLLRRLAQETKHICSSPSAVAARPITFGYDAVSYAKNFDDGRSPAPPYAAAAANATDKSSGN
ncbi:uncharacterized protein LOC133910088 [Phragmites australis]|uniref:uncharacterized protein LOC133910088 n=1 Tax=Phragmites australis TaxID=29695 RepID=UPI002D7A0B0F|nr:uncharacterized protein LOC133910088 [Phragmites australis]